MRWRLIFLFGTISLSSCTGVEQDGAQWPTQGWQRSSPEEQGMDSARLSKLDQEISEGNYGYIDSMLVIRNGHIVYDRSYEQDYDSLYVGRDHTPGPYNYFNPEWHPYYQRGRLHTLQSVTKSITSAVIGVALRRKEISGVEMPILHFFDEYDVQNVDDWKKAITLEDLLTMRAGFDWDEHSIPYDNPKNPAVEMERSDNWIKYVIDRPMAHEPGTFFAYSSGVSQLLSLIMKKSTGMDIDEYAEQRLFKPLGVISYHWKRTPQNLPDTEGGLYLMPHDLAKVGYLYLEDGVWDGTRILPEGWARRSVESIVEDVAPDDDVNNMGYGYQWWTIPYQGVSASHFFAGRGYGGQRLYVLPEYQLVTVFTGWNIDGTSRGIPLQVFFDSVLKAVKKETVH